VARAIRWAPRPRGHTRTSGPSDERRNEAQFHPLPLRRACGRSSWCTESSWCTGWMHPPSGDVADNTVLAHRQSVPIVSRSRRRDVGIVRAGPRHVGCTCGGTVFRRAARADPDRAVRGHVGGCVLQLPTPDGAEGQLFPERRDARRGRGAVLSGARSTQRHAGAGGSLQRARRLRSCAAHLHSHATRVDRTAAAGRTPIRARGSLRSRPAGIGGPLRWSTE
jgi:hypothetical protein